MYRIADSIPFHRRLPRCTVWFIIAAMSLAVIAITSPVQLPIVLYKLSLISLAAVVGYWIDRSLFPYSRPDGYMVRNWRYGTEEPEGDVDFPLVSGYHLVFSAAVIRRAIVVAAVMIGVALGL